jgi:PIN domain nuclease of toxin-antitoxin system
LSRVILDSSAVLALLNEEPGSERIWPLVGEAGISAVNAAEVQGKLVRIGLPPNAAWEAVLGCVQEVIPFDSRQAEAAGNLLLRTASLGLSLGDRACIALATILQLPVYTADRAWGKFDAEVEINLIR